MKKLAAISFAFFYLFISAGFTLTMHYCEGKLEAFEMTAEKISCCCETKAGADPCCEDETFRLQFDEVQTASESQRVAAGIAFTTFFSNTLNTAPGLSFAEEIISITHPPEPTVIKPMRLLYSSLTFYG